MKRYQKGVDVMQAFTCRFWYVKMNIKFKSKTAKNVVKGHVHSTHTDMMQTYNFF